MPGLDPGIHVFWMTDKRTWMAGTSPAMTRPLTRTVRSSRPGSCAGSAPADRTPLNGAFARFRWRSATSQGNVKVHVKVHLKVHVKLQVPVRAKVEETAGSST